jgi:hypothetical protein
MDAGGPVSRLGADLRLRVFTNHFFFLQPLSEQTP